MDVITAVVEGKAFKFRCAQGLRVFFKHFRRPDGQRAVYKNGHVRRKLVTVAQQYQAVQQLLRTPYGEGGNDDLLFTVITV